MRRLLVGCAVLTIALGAAGVSAAQEEPPAAGAFSPAGSLSETRARHSAISLPDGRVFIVGGDSVNIVLDEDGVAEPIGLPHHTAEVWGPATGTFSPAGSHASCHGWDPAILLPDGRVLIVGGCIVPVPASAELWDPETGTFSPTGTLEEAPMYGPRTVLPDGRILFVGGMGHEEEPLVAAAVIWDPQTASSEPAGTLETPRQGSTATLLPDGRVLVVGGLGPFGSDNASAELWDPVSGTFGPAGRLLNGPRINHTASLLDDGRVLVVGGDGTNGTFTSAELWDPQTASFGPAGSLAEGRGGQAAAHTATLLPDGRVLVVGGFGANGPLAFAELWDPHTASFGPAGSLAQARGHHTATLLPDGRVLVVGGDDGDDDFFASAEFWQPTDG